MTGLRDGQVTLPTGARIYYQRAGEGDPLLLLHGIASSTQVWRRLIPALAERHDVIAIDLPGCGRSHKPESDYSVGTQTASIRYVLDALGVDLATVVGHSLGGAVAMSFAYHYPERVGRMALIGSAGLGREMHLLLRLATLPVVPRRLLSLLASPRLRLLARGLEAAMDRLGVEPLLPHRSRHRSDVDELLDRFGDPAVQRAFFGMLASGSSISGQAVSALDRLGMCLFPVLIVWGRNDGIFPMAHAERAARLIPHARLVVLDDCGHFPQLEAPGPFGSALATWLEETRPERLDLAALRRRLDGPRDEQLPDRAAQHDDDEPQDHQPPRGDAALGVGFPAHPDHEEGAAGELGGHRHAGAHHGEGDADDPQDAEPHQLSMPRALA
ncbi:MAG TPA: alpha/beta hydrolase [Candidatus Dormibacteraeota bacterium]